MMKGVHVRLGHITRLHYAVSILIIGGTQGEAMRSSQTSYSRGVFVYHSDQVAAAVFEAERNFPFAGFCCVLTFTDIGSSVCRSPISASVLAPLELVMRFSRSAIREDCVLFASISWAITAL
ncbi:hypothetical protein V7S43_002537 [Phytophthora oleae]|uniref:Uncharacterized protein n=1 Tax=Phytophthora oleae TaxID=2107226 RepID=A0ABD3G3T2_9STRA